MTLQERLKKIFKENAIVVNETDAGVEMISLNTFIRVASELLEEGKRPENKSERQKEWKSKRDNFYSLQEKYKLEIDRIALESFDPYNDKHLKIIEIFKAGVPWKTTQKKVMYYNIVWRRRQEIKKATAAY